MPKVYSHSVNYATHLMKSLFFLLPAICLSACLAQPTPEPMPTFSKPFVLIPADNPYAPKPVDKNYRPAGVVLTSINLVERIDLNPAQVELDLLGWMPGTCNELRINVGLPNNEYQIFVDVYSLVRPILNCEDVFQQFKASLLLGVYSPGRFTVSVNQESIGDFISQ